MRSPLIILALLAALGAAVLGIVVLHRASRAPVRPSVAESENSTAPARPPEIAGEDEVGRALRLAAIDTTRKREWVEDVPDLELSDMSPVARALFLTIANGRRCTCGCGFTLAGCRRFDAECEVSGPRAEALFDSVREGRITRADGFRARPATR